MSQFTRSRAGGFEPPPNVRKAVRKILDEQGERAACQQLGLSRLSVAKLAAGLPLHKTTTAYAAAKLGLVVEA